MQPFGAPYVPSRVLLDEYNALFIPAFSKPIPTYVQDETGFKNGIALFFLQ